MPAPSEEVPRDAIDRLLEAWRSEIEASALHELIAQGETNGRRAEILRPYPVGLAFPT